MQCISLGILAVDVLSDLHWGKPMDSSYIWRHLAGKTTGNRPGVFTLVFCWLSAKHSMKGWLDFAQMQRVWEMCAGWLVGSVHIKQLTPETRG